MRAQANGAAHRLSVSPVRYCPVVMPAKEQVPGATECRDQPVWEPIAAGYGVLR